MPSPHSKRVRQSATKGPEPKRVDQEENSDDSENEIQNKRARRDKPAKTHAGGDDGLAVSGQQQQTMSKQNRKSPGDERKGSIGLCLDSKKPSKKAVKAASKPSVTGDRCKAGTECMKVEMHFLHKGRKIKMKLFGSVQISSDETGISSELISAVCEEGGGFLGGSWFQYEKNLSSSDNRNRKPNATSAQLRTKEFFQGGVRFDLSQLRPLEGKDMSSRQWWKRVIELVCKRTGQTPVCFPSVRAAAAAMGISPDQVIRACNTYATAEQYSFINYFLRYKMDSKAHLYGSDRNDYKEVVNKAAGSSETDRTDHRQSLKSVVAKTSPSSKFFKHRRHQFEPAKEVYFRELAPTSPIVLEAVQLFNDGEATGSTTPPRNNHDTILLDVATEDGGRERLCIFCQEKASEIIFEPCGHSVICESCASWACRLFCPRCRTRISKRRRSTSLFRGVKLDLGVKPRTFSAYSFMDFSG